MDYEQLSKTDQLWEKYHEYIKFAIKDKKQDAEAGSFIKVPFKDALNLVQSRSVFLHQGIAFVHISDLNTIARA